MGVCVCGGVSGLCTSSSFHSTVHSLLWILVKCKMSCENARYDDDNISV